MEDVLDLYEEPYDRKSPTVCLDEKPVVLHADVHLPVPVETGQPERVDYEYERKGTRNLFVMVEPLAGWQHVEVTKQRTSAATTPRWYASWLMRFIRTQNTFDWCRIPSILIRRLRCMRRFRRVKLAAFCNAWSFITRGIHGGREYGGNRDHDSQRNALSQRVARRGDAASASAGRRNGAHCATPRHLLAIHAGAMRDANLNGSIP